MKHEVETQWMGKMQFNSLVNGHTIVMDAPERIGGDDAGPIPKPLLLTSLSGCTGMDVIALMRKQNATLQDFNVKVWGEVSKQQPIQYTHIHIIYELKGEDVYKDIAIKAIQDSQEIFCGVSAMVKRALPVTWEISYNNTEVFNNLKQEVPI